MKKTTTTVEYPFNTLQSKILSSSQTNIHSLLAPKELGRARTFFL